ncbi:unnamed protein product [Mytilus edulis]|uniref:Uncharacterized protein n=1 Tax=Mytilus edulis TaxID=6550 RepID=A0A8S3QHB1_MYTED|nr:unnamed protein product [Mytilus edulis]
MWNLRAKSLCGDKNKYMCLYDTNERKFRELCKDKPDFHRSGNIFVISGNLQYFAEDHVIATDINHINGGQMVAVIVSTLSQCATEKGRYLSTMEQYQETENVDVTILITILFSKNRTMNRCHCDPTEEDCSCYLKKCKIDEVLTPGTSNIVPYI